jgi:hypothetical protein
LSTKKTSTKLQKSTKRKKSTKLAEGAPLKIRPDYSHSFPNLYANYASIGHTPFEFAIDFCTIPSPGTATIKDDVLYAPITVRLLIPPAVAASLVSALQIQLEKYKETYQQSPAESLGQE